MQSKSSSNPTHFFARPYFYQFIFRSAAFRCTVFKTRKETATNTVRTIGQAFDVVHRIVEAEKDQNNNLDNLDKDEIEKEIVFSPRKSIKSNKVRSTVRDVSSLRVLSSDHF